jgi:adenylate kinase family enzyme
MQPLAQALPRVLRQGLPAAAAAASAAAPSSAAAFASAAAPSNGEIRWVFLGPPGVGKGTYASRIAKHLGVPHIAAGDLVRAEIKSGSALGQQVRRTLPGGSAAARCCRAHITRPVQAKQRALRGGQRRLQPMQPSAAAVAVGLMRHSPLIQNPHQSPPQMQQIVNEGRLLPDDVVLSALTSRIAAGREQGESGFLLDGFPRTRAQVTGLRACTYSKDPVYFYCPMQRQTTKGLPLAPK